MKYLIVILAFYMLTLALLPCGDKVECIDNERYETTFNDNDHPDHDGHAENCSPFCICACCGQMLNIFTAYHFDIKPTFAAVTSRSLYADPYFKIIPQSIWQPPKLV
ncbi:DUF6660 family protein [Dyadobacter sp. CY326]|uniref:DUF6660 family protein n=1 Tax=Dyadobacter sp. CY326 TaxID=2907300 RepID=UPI001F27EA71|nr:DUF6660 family protein [Dyadobacter sp. CY326]MCE7068516.1 hypothetical protein [Dyadobacter sp. CY326]